MNKITMEMIDEFNVVMENMDSIIRLKPDYNSVDIKVKDDKYLNMKDQIINPSKEFYDVLQSFFLNKGVKINFNNTWSCFWSEDVSEIRFKNSQ